MKYRIFFIAVMFSVFGCKSTSSAIDSDSYGYSETNPVKVGGFQQGPANERKFLNSLTGPNGETVTYTRLGSCCMFETEKSTFGSGMLDKYEVTIEGQEEKKIIYINMYDKDELFAPKGFLIKK